MSADTRSRYIGCLLGGAVGDALGAPVEFASGAQILAAFGPLGVREFRPAYGRPAAITDDTQMTVAGALAIVDEVRHYGRPETSRLAAAVNGAYLQWYEFQRWFSRAPGGTCMGALSRGGGGSIYRAINDSKGCGGVMRAAPAGLLYRTDPEEAYRFGAWTAALTHGHPLGWMSAGVVAAVVAVLADGGSVLDGILIAQHLLFECTSDEARAGALPACAAQMSRLLDTVMDVAESAEGEGPYAAKLPGRPVVCRDGSRVPSVVGLVTRLGLGGGWVGEEAAAIALYAALVARDFTEGVAIAVSHGGDSDSTGAIAGNLLGAKFGLAYYRPDLEYGIDARGVPATLGRTVEDSEDLIRLGLDLEEVSRPANWLRRPWRDPTWTGDHRLRHQIQPILVPKLPAHRRQRDAQGRFIG